MLALAPGCQSCRGEAPLPPGQPGQAWRDQFVFIGDEDLVAALVVQRAGGGEIEVKGWIAVGDKFRAVLYERTPLDPGRAPSLEASVDDFAERAHAAPVRLRMIRRKDLLREELQTPSVRLSLESDSLRAATEAPSPEGPLRWSAGPATLTVDERPFSGVVLAEETPAAHPLASEVDYGDFALVFARRHGEPMIARRSLDHPAFDRAIALRSANHPAPRLDTAPDALLLDGSRLPILDRLTTTGSTSDGTPRRYEVLLLGGDPRGIAFRISPAPPDAPPDAQSPPLH